MRYALFRRGAFSSFTPKILNLKQLNTISQTELGTIIMAKVTFFINISVVNLRNFRRKCGKDFSHRAENRSTGVNFHPSAILFHHPNL